MLFIIALSVLFQIATSFLALKLIHTTKRTSAWLLLAAAIFLMAVRRVESLGRFLSGAPVTRPDMEFEITGLVVSVLMFAGVYLIQPLFSALIRSKEDLLAAHNRLSVVSEERRMLLDHTCDFIYRHSINGVIDYISPAVETITGYSPAEWHAHYTAHYTDNDVNKSGIAATNDMLRTGKEGLPYRVEVRRKQGGVVWLEVNKQPYLIDGRIAGFIGVARDITKRVALEEEREKLIRDLKDALSKIKALRGLLPICAACKKIRDDHGYWRQIETYIKEHSEAEFSHGICPECARILYPDHFKG